jgi:hypothetical protein
VSLAVKPVKQGINLLTLECLDSLMRFLALGLEGLESSLESLLGLINLFDLELRTLKTINQ